MSKLKDGKIRNLLKVGWYKVTNNPPPSSIAFGLAVVKHNAAFGEGNKSSDWSRGNGGSGRIYTSQGTFYEPGRASRVISASAPVVKVDDVWKCEAQDVKGCPIAATPMIEVPMEMYRAWTELAGEFDTEWMAYLIGEVNVETMTGVVTEMYFPPQTASGAHVEIPEELDATFRQRPGTIGAVHSHVQMQAFFSSTDENHANWPIEVVINAKGESSMRMRGKLGCGRYSRIDGKIKLTGAKAADVYRDSLKAALKEGEDTKGHGEVDVPVSGSLAYGGMY